MNIKNEINEIWTAMPASLCNEPFVKTLYRAAIMAAEKGMQGAQALTDVQIDDMAFGYAPSGKIGELREFARAFLAAQPVAQTVAERYGDGLRVAIENISNQWDRQKGLFPDLSKDGWMDLAVKTLVAAGNSLTPDPTAESYSDMLREFFFQHSAGGYNSEGLVSVDVARDKLHWIVDDARRSALAAPVASKEAVSDEADFLDAAKKSGILPWHDATPTTAAEGVPSVDTEGK